MTRSYTAERIGTPAPDTPLLPPITLLPSIPGFSRCTPPESVTLVRQQEHVTAIRSGSTSGLLTR